MIQRREKDIRSVSQVWQSGAAALAQAVSLPFRWGSDECIDACFKLSLEISASVPLFATFKRLGAGAQ